MLPGKFHKLVYLCNRYVNTLGNLRNTGIARCAIYLLHTGALPQFPDQGMFPPPAANHKYTHFFPPWLMFEITGTGHHHDQALLITSSNGILIVDRTSGLDNCF